MWEIAFRQTNFHTEATHRGGHREEVHRGHTEGTDVKATQRPYNDHTEGAQRLHKWGTEGDMRTTQWSIGSLY